MQDCIEHNYLICPHCKTITTAFYTNKEIRDMQIQQAKLSMDRRFTEMGDIYKKFNPTQVPDGFSYTSDINELISDNELKELVDEYSKINK